MMALGEKEAALPERPVSSDDLFGDVTVLVGDGLGSCMGLPRRVGRGGRL